MARTDVELHTPAEWASLIGGLLQLMQQRAPGRALVRVLTPEAAMPAAA